MWTKQLASLKWAECLPAGFSADFIEGLGRNSSDTKNGVLSCLPQLQPGTWPRSLARKLLCLKPLGSQLRPAFPFSTPLFPKQGMPGGSAMDWALTRSREPSTRCAQSGWPYRKQCFWRISRIPSRLHTIIPSFCLCQTLLEQGQRANFYLSILVLRKRSNCWTQAMYHWKNAKISDSMQRSGDTAKCTSHFDGTQCSNLGNSFLMHNYNIL